MLWLLGCKTGSFGFDCNETCEHCNEVNQCSKIDGICSTGCKAGFQGELCTSCSYFSNIYVKHSTRIYFVLKHIGIARERYNER